MTDKKHTPAIYELIMLLDCLRKSEDKATRLRIPHLEKLLLSEIDKKWITRIEQ